MNHSTAPTDTTDTTETTDPPHDRNTPIDTSGYVRRARRSADLSQRDLAAAVGVSQSNISRIESGGGLSVREFERMLSVAGLRIAVVDESGVEIEPMPQDVLRDRAGRRQPAHLDVHAPPELPTTRMLLRAADPITRPSWHHRRRDRDLLRSKGIGTPEQLTARAIAAAAAARRSRAGPTPPFSASATMAASRARAASLFRNENRPDSSDSGIVTPAVTEDPDDAERPWIHHPPACDG
ncbi:helix-turn-helix domain-containing protein [uncultured Microbacterium sp.]|uniref:helix-turn-helix domain-containing protein n=1 Tax=uncultured Microbacterium sp. TaxID=191216 RepID=UPI0035CB8336